MITLDSVQLNSIKIETLSESNHPLKIEQFQLGDELMVYHPLDRSNSLDNASLSLLIEGQARVLCMQTFQQREITALLLQGGDTFGADHLFQELLLPYRVIAASKCQIAQISLNQLTAIFCHIPALQRQIAQQVREREKLIFFKSLTQLRSLPSHQIQKQILPRLVEQSIKAGESLIKANSVDKGYWWLRSGQIQSSSASVSPMIGEGWKYTDPNLSDWLAATDLLLYKLPINGWELAELLNLL